MKRLLLALMLTTGPAVALAAEPASVYDMTQALSNQLATEALSVCHNMNRQAWLPWWIGVEIWSR